MEINWLAILLPALPSIVAAVIAYRINKKGDERHAEAEKRHDERVKAERLSMEMQLATADLSYASAMALKRGKANGEVEAGIASYEKAKKDYFDFINKKYLEDITK